MSRYSRFVWGHKGFTLIEMMVAMTIGLIVLLGVGAIYLSSVRTYRIQEDDARLQESGRYVLELIGRSIRQAGGDAEMNFSPVANTLNCVAPACQPVGGTNGAGATPDTLAVQFYANRDELVAGNWITRDCTGGVNQANANTLITNTFSLVGTSFRCNGSTGGVQEIVAGVEDFQVLYGIDTTGDQSVDQYQAAPANWDQVRTARICLVMTSNNNRLSDTPQRFLNCAGALGVVGATLADGGLTDAAAGDLRLRRTFVATFNLRNRITAMP